MLDGPSRGTVSHGAGPLGPLLHDLDPEPDGEKAWDRLEHLGRRTRQGLISLHAGDPPDEAELVRSFGPLFDLVDRHVTVRIVCPASFAAPGHVRHLVVSLGERGVPVRFVDNVPQRILVSDDVRAALPLDGTRLAEGTVFVNERRLVTALAAAARRIFAAGVPLEHLPRAGDELAPTVIERRVVRLLASGITDEVAARRLSITDRQYRRYVSAVMRRLHASSRFQAGVKASERGWI